MPRCSLLRTWDSFHLSHIKVISKNSLIFLTNNCCKILSPIFKVKIFIEHWEKLRTREGEGVPKTAKQIKGYLDGESRPLGS